jgi:hypothetical protein
VYGGTLYFQSNVAGRRSATSVAYSTTLHHFWRFRHDPATDRIFFETSVDGATWATQRTVGRQITLASLRLELNVGKPKSTRQPGAAIFDNFRLEPNNPSIANGTFRVEAESGSLTSPMTILTVGQAFGSQYVSPSFTDSGNATFKVNIATAGNYIFY